MRRARDRREGRGSGIRVWEAYLAGGRTPTGVTSFMAREARSGGRGDTAHDMDRDGTSDGYDLDLNGP